MRWPFHFGRSRDGGAAPAPEPPALPRRRDWASLPPIQRVIEEQQLTAPTPQFVDSLAGTQEPALNLEALGHHVSLEGPQGLVAGIATTVDTYSPAVEMVGRPRRRGPAVAGAPAGTEVASEVDAVDQVGAVDVGEKAADLGEEALPDSPLRSLAVVEPVIPSRMPLTRLADSGSPTVTQAFSVQRSAEERPEPPAVPMITSEPGLAAPGSAAVAQRLTLGQSRRRGLGPPLNTSAFAAVQRSSSSPDEGDAMAATPNIHEASTRADLEPSLPSRPSEGPAVETSVEASTYAPLAGLPFLPVVRRHVHAGSPEVTAESGELQPTPVPDLHVRPGFRTQPAESHATPTPTPAPAPSVQRTTAMTLPPRAEPRAAGQILTAPLVPGGEPLLASRRAAQASPRDAQPVAAVQRQPATGFAMEWLPEPMAQTQPVLTWGPPSHIPEVVTAAPVPRRPAPARGSLFWNVQRETIDVPATGEAPEGPAASPGSSPGQTVAMAPRPADSTATSAGPPQAGATTFASAAEPAPAAAAAAPAARSPESEKDLDELARKLHERISSRIRYDLLVDRERAGMITDLR